MIIDMHTHIFPDKIAPATISALEKAGNSPAHTDGTRNGLITSMKSAGIDCSVILPVVTKPEQFKSVNTFAAHVNSRFHHDDKYQLLSFGGIHPDTNDYKGELQEIKKLGLKGIKIHPDYQKTYIDDIKYMRIIDYASELGLIITTHAGIDIGLPSPVHCTPARVFQLLKQITPLNFILAHMGGIDCWDEVAQFLIGQSIYMDMAYVLGKIPEKQLLQMIRTHGADKILFATDSPWGRQKDDVAYLKKLPLTRAEQEYIFYKNAKSLGI